MKFSMTICLVVLVVCSVYGTPYGPRDRDIETHHSRDGEVSTGIERVDNNHNNGGHHHGRHGNDQGGRFDGHDRNEGTGRGHTSIGKDSPYRY